MADDVVQRIIGAATAHAGAPVKVDPVDQPQPDAQEPSTPFAKAVAGNKDLLEQSGITGDRFSMFAGQLGHESAGFKAMTELPSQYASSQDEYKGRGFIQLTGKSNYADMSNKLGIDLVNNPQLASDPDVAMKVAVQYWNDHNLNSTADAGDYQGITKAINGPAMLHQASRDQWLNKSRAAMQANNNNVIAAAGSLETPSQTFGDSLFNAPGEVTLASKAGRAAIPQTVPGTFEYIQNQFAAERSRTLQGQYNAVADQVNPILDKIKQKTGKDYDIGTVDLTSRLFSGDNLVNNPLDAMGKKFDSALAELKQTYPDQNFGVKSFQDILDRASAQYAATEKQNAEDTSHVGWATYLAGMLAQGAGWMSDPLNAASSVAMGAALSAAAPAALAGLAGTALNAGISMAGTAAIQQPMVQEERGQLGQANGPEEARQEVLQSGIGGAAGVLGLGLLGKAVKGVFSGGFGGVGDFTKKFFSPGGAKEILNKAKEGNGGDLPKELLPLENAARFVAENPLGSTPAAQEALSVHMETAYNQIQHGESLHVLPPGVTGAKIEPPFTEIQQQLVAELKDEGFMDADSVQRAMKTINAARGEAGNVPLEEYAQLDAPLEEVPSALENLTKAQNAAWDKENETFSSLPEAAKQAQTELQSKLAQWGSTPEMATERMGARSEELKAGINKAQVQLKNDFWEDAHGYSTNPVDAADRARRHVTSRLAKMQEELAGLNDLQGQMEVHPETGLLQTPKAAFESRLQSLKEDVPQATAALSRKIDLANSQLEGLATRMERIQKQNDIYMQKAEDIKAQFPNPDELDKLHLQSQLYPYEQKFQEAKLDIESINQTKQILEGRVQEAKELHDTISAANLKAGPESDLSPWASAEQAIQKVKEQEAVNNTSMPLTADEQGFVTSRTTTPQMHQDLAEKFSSLKALNDCIGRNS